MTDTITTTGADTQTKTSGLVSSFFNSFSKLSSATDSGSLFDSLLTDIRATTPTPVQPTSAPPQTPDANQPLQSAVVKSGQTASQNVKTAGLSTDKNVPALANKKSHSRRPTNTPDQELNADQVAQPATQATTPTPVISSLASTNNSPTATPSSTSADVSTKDNNGTTTAETQPTPLVTPNASTQSSNSQNLPSLTDALAGLHDVLQTIRQQQADKNSSNTPPTNSNLSAPAASASDAAAPNNQASESITQKDPSSLHELDQALSALKQLSQTVQTSNADSAKSQAAQTPVVPQAGSTTSDKINPIATTALSQPTDTSSSQYGKGTADNSAAQPRPTIQTTTVNAVDSKSSNIPSDAKIATVTGLTAPLVASQSNADTSSVSNTIVNNDVSKQANQLVNAAVSAAVVAPTAVAPAPSYQAVNNAPTQPVAVVASTDQDSSADAETDDGSDDLANNSFGELSRNTPTAGLENTKTTSSYNFASQLSATHNSPASSGSFPTASDQVKFQLSRMAKSGNDLMTLQLQPAELGRINIKLTIDHDGNVQGTVVANSPATLAMLQKDSHNLERALQDAGLRTDNGSLQFSLSDQGAGQGQNPSRQTADSSSLYSGTGLSTLANANETAGTLQPEQWIISSNRVNMKV
jgi:hypothetical protein